MDPNATYLEMIAAHFGMGDANAIKELNAWLARGGFPPADADTCRWFAGCDRPTAVFIAHPAMAPVPTCKECASKLERLSA